MSRVAIKLLPRFLIIKYNNKPQIPHFVSLDARQIERGVQGLPAFRAFVDKLRVLRIEGEESGCAVSFLGGSDVGVETEGCYAGYWARGVGGRHID
jgi:hypothetical protein